MDRRSGAADQNGAHEARATAAASGSRWHRLHSWLIAARASDEEDHRRELTLNWLLLLSIALAVLEAGQRLPAVIQGGAAASDHGPTFVLACVAGVAFSSLLALSRCGRQVLAARGLLCAYYAVATWLFVAEGTEEPAALVLCSMLVVAGGVLLGTRVSVSAVLLITATLITVGALDSAGVIEPGAGSSAPGVLEQLGIGGGLGALALVLSARTGERHGSVGELLSGVNGSAPELSGALIATLTVRELQVVRLVAAGRSNAEIARELFLSPRTVHTHVSNALRKTNCTNRTELAVLAIQRDVSIGASPVGHVATIRP